MTDDHIRSNDRELETGTETRDFLDDPTPAKWEAFVRRYSKRIAGWCGQRLFQDHEAEDLMQEIWIKLYLGLPTFDYRKTSRFRYWLSKVKTSAWATFLGRHHQRNVLAGAFPVEAADRVAPELSELLDDLELVRVAEERVRTRVGEIQWKAYRLRTHHGHSARETAELLDLTPATVDTYNSAVRGQVEEELRRRHPNLRDETGSTP
ncbi:MAG: RNA polymerase sigma factor [Planctomycetota bacterium]|nr:RNA polymerase sigma factor [Planctomycetota bacterium]